MEDTPATIPTQPTAAAQRPMSSLTPGRYPLLAGLLGGIVGAVLAVGIGWYTLIKPMHHRLQQTPPVVVVDFVRLAQQYPEGASAEEVERLMRKTNTALLKLRDAGYVVLDAQAVLAAPDELLVTSDLLQ